MAENVGHLVVVESSLDNVTYTEIDGNESFGNSRSRDALEVTAFKDPTGAKIRIMGLREGGCDLGGPIVFQSGAPALSLDIGIKNVLSALRTGADLYLRGKMDGAGGTYKGAIGLTESFTLTADVAGAVKWSAKTCFNGAGWQ